MTGAARNVERALSEPRDAGRASRWHAHLPVDEHDSAATYFTCLSHVPSLCATPTSGRHVHQQDSAPTSMETVMKAALGSLSLIVLSSGLFFAQVQPVPDQRPLAFTHVT